MTTQERCKTVLVVDDDHAVRFVLEQALSRAGFRVESFADGEGALAAVRAGRGDLVITDIVMPAESGLDLLQTIKTGHPLMPVIVITAQSTLVNAVSAFERGAFEYLPKPFDINRVVDLARRAVMESRNAPLDRSDGSDQPSGTGGIIGSSMAMQELFRTIGRLAQSEMTVLIHGESGTGKELVARAIHAHSPRRDGPFTAINMAAIPRELIESELFGHEKGAFTGAVARRIGPFERSEGGTLFLDEIGDMPMEAQTRLLRVLQDGTFTRIGGSQVLPARVRIIAATHQDLPAAIGAGRFREDLFYRLNVIPLEVPALRSRREDIPLLVNCFLADAARSLRVPPKRVTAEAMARLSALDWPGNVRELENLVRRLMVLVPVAVIDEGHLGAMGSPDPPAVAPGGKMEPIGEALPAGVGRPATALREAVAQELDRYFSALDGFPTTQLYERVIREVDYAMIVRVLREARGNQLKAATMLGINRNTLRKKIRDLEIDLKNCL